MIKSTKDRDQIIKIIKAAFAANEPPETAVERILETMSHVTAAAVGKICAVCAE